MSLGTAKCIWHQDYSFLWASRIEGLLLGFWRAKQEPWWPLLRCKLLQKRPIESIDQVQPLIHIVAHRYPCLGSILLLATQEPAGGATLHVRSLDRLTRKLLGLAGVSYVTGHGTMDALGHCCVQYVCT